MQNRGVDMKFLKHWLIGFYLILKLIIGCIIVLLLFIPMAPYMFYCDHKEIDNKYAKWWFKFTFGFE